MNRVAMLASEQRKTFGSPIDDQREHIEHVASKHTHFEGVRSSQAANSPRNMTCAPSSRSDRICV